MDSITDMSRFIHDMNFIDAKKHSFDNFIVVINSKMERDLYLEDVVPSNELDLRKHFKDKFGENVELIVSDDFEVIDKPIYRITKRVFHSQS